MCIIVAKPIGIDVPNREVLINCFNNNKHGAGIMFNHNDRVYIYKGFMTIDSFLIMLNKLEKKYKLKNKGVVFHFRISTQGIIDEGNCHPFPISDDDNILRKTKIITKDVAMAHNGTIKRFSNSSNFLNDTQLFIKEVVSTLYELNKSFYQNKKAQFLLEDLAGSKLCFLDKAGNTYLLGDFIENDGVYYSNNSYQKNGRIISCHSHIQENVSIFDELYFNMDEVDTSDNKIKNKEFDTLLKKVSFLEKGEVVFNFNRDNAYEADDFKTDLAYDDDMNLYEIDTKNRVASLIEVDIQFLEGVENT